MTGGVTGRLDRQTPMMPIDGVVFQRSRVKSGKSMELLLLVTDFSLSSVMQLQAAAS